MRSCRRQRAERLTAVGRGAFDQAVRVAVADDPLLAELIDAMLSARDALWREYCRLNDLVVRMVARRELSRRFMAIPGVGPVTTLSFMTAIDNPSRFRRSRNVAAYFGLISRCWQSGSTIDIQGRISKAGDADVRGSLYDAASGPMTRFKGSDKVKSRGLAVIMHALWSDGTFYVGDAAATATDTAQRAHGKACKLLGAHR